jgi:hypothetical protein
MRGGKQGHTMPETRCSVTTDLDQMDRQAGCGVGFCPQKNGPVPGPIARAANSDIFDVAWFHYIWRDCPASPRASHGPG